MINVYRVQVNPEIAVVVESSGNVVLEHKVRSRRDGLWHVGQSTITDIEYLREQLAIAKLVAQGIESER